MGCRSRAMPMPRAGHSSGPEAARGGRSRTRHVKPARRPFFVDELWTVSTKSVVRRRKSWISGYRNLLPPPYSWSCPEGPTKNEAIQVGACSDQIAPGACIRCGGAWREAAVSLGILLCPAPGDARASSVASPRDAGFRPTRSSKRDCQRQGRRWQRARNRRCWRARWWTDCGWQREIRRWDHESRG